MVLRQQIWEGARTFVRLQVCNKANCLPYPFCSYHRDKNHAPKAKKGLPPARASFLVNSFCSHSFPLKFAAVVFRFFGFFRGVGNGWVVFEWCQMSFQFRTLHKFGTSTRNLKIWPKRVDVVFTSGIEIRDRNVMSPQAHCHLRASVYGITYESKWMNPTSKRAAMVYITSILYEQLYNFLIYPKFWEINFKS